VDGGTTSNMQGSCECIEKQCRTADHGGPVAWGLGEVLTTLHFKKRHFCETDTCTSGLDCFFVRPKQWKRNMRVGTWNVRSLYRSGLQITIVRELAR
jgi:hypothetical protein